MTKLYFRHGTMNSSKSANLIMVAHNYKSQNKKIIVIKPSIDTRFDKNKVVSRTGMKIDVDYIINADTIIKKIVDDDIKCILVDEAQFLTSGNVEDLKDISQKIPVIAYGLKTDYMSKLFEGSKRLIELADSIEEIKTICASPECNRKATINAKFILKNNIKIIQYSGHQIDLGAEEKYVAMCYGCWKQ
jgi:thymidine kinase